MWDNPFGREQEDLAALSRLDQVERLKNGLVSRATGGGFEGGDLAYQQLRAALRQDPATNAKLPGFVRNCSNLAQFWGLIQTRFDNYKQRREHIWEAFAPIIAQLEGAERTPAAFGEALTRFDAEGVRAAWEKALARRNSDPDGAITAARSLVETVCKHILDDAAVPYAPNEDLPKLWHLTAELLNLAPNQHQEPTFKAILGNCQSVVNHLAAIRNSVSDAHGQGRRRVKPAARHAELAVNLAGSMATFLVATWQERTGRG